MAYSLTTAAIAPIVGTLSDILGRRHFGLSGSLLIVVGMIIVGLAGDVHVGISGMAIAGVGGGISQVIGIAGIAELASVKSRGKYLGTAFTALLPFGACQVYG
jgi:MFS family permease